MSLGDSSDAFEAFGMHWLLTIETQKPVKGQHKRDILVVLWCLSCDIPSQDRRDGMPLKGPWDVPFSSDGRLRSYDAREGTFCNLIGADFPADAVKFDAIKISLDSGTTTKTLIVRSTLPDDYGDAYGGYYDETWYGVGQVMLPKFEYDAEGRGASIFLTLQFMNKAPKAMCEYCPQNASPTEDPASSSTSNPENSKKRKVNVKTEN
ncbi:MAG: hypothetical protein SGARI_005812 [Bacillariaceae sp.]